MGAGTGNLPSVIINPKEWIIFKSSRFLESASVAVVDVKRGAGQRAEFVSPERRGRVHIS